MSVIVGRLAELETPPNVPRLMAHAATVRALLDELDRAAPSHDLDLWSLADRESVVAEHLAEELTRLGCLMVECGAAVSLITVELARRRA
jgi:hypothetical protein